MSKTKRILTVCLVFLFMIPLFNLAGGPNVVSVSAASSSEILAELEELEAQNAELEAEIAELQNQLDMNMEELSGLVAKKDLVDQEIVLLYEQIKVVNNQIDTISELIADKQEELEAAEADLKALQEKNTERIRAMEENGDLSYWTVLAGANSFMELLDRWEMATEIAKADQLCLAELDAAAAEVASAKAELATEQETLQEKREYMDKVEASLEAKREETDELLIEMKAKTDEFAQMIEESEALQEELMAEIAAANQEYEEALEWEEQQNQATGPMVGGATNTVDGIVWTMPCTYTRLTSPFGYRYHPISGVWKMHNGVDLAGYSGTPIVATRSGYVTTASYQAGGAGYYVSISHGDGFGSIYMHMTHFIVSYGQYVQAGQVIGYMGTTGGSTGVHLHFGISYNGVYVNPANYLNF